MRIIFTVVRIIESFLWPWGSCSYLSLTFVSFDIEVTLLVNFIIVNCQNHIQLLVQGGWGLLDKVHRNLMIEMCSLQRSPNLFALFNSVNLLQNNLSNK